MRIVLFTGKGGVGKTTSAAAVATRAASAGQKTLVLSTDPAHSLSDTLDIPLDSEPREVTANLFAAHVEAQDTIAHSWGAIREYLTGALGHIGVEPLAAEQLLYPPGAAEICALLAIRDHARSGAYDVIVLDCAPTADTLRLLSLPETFAWYLSRLVGKQGSFVRSLGSLLGGALADSAALIPSEGAVTALRRLGNELADTHTLLTDRSVSSIRLVLTPEAVVVAEARRIFTSLSLYGFAVDGIVVNRVIPDDGDDPWRQTWAAAQRRQLAEIQDGFSSVPRFVVPYLPTEPVGVPALGELAAATYGAADAFALAQGAPPLAVSHDGNVCVIAVALPLADKSKVDVTRIRDDVIVSYAGQRRIIALPDGCRDHGVSEAMLRDGLLTIRLNSDAGRHQ